LETHQGNLSSNGSHLSTSNTVLARMWVQYIIHDIHP
jgi:hypothetical protein